MGIGSMARNLMGGPEKSSSSSGNHAYGEINSALSPAMGYVTQGGNMMGNLLGVGGAPAQTDALNNFANSGGMQFLMQQMAKGVTSTKASQGLLNSGSYGTALQDRSMGLASTYLNQYMQDLMGYSKLGIDSAQTIGEAGKFGESNSEGAKKGLLPTILSAIPAPVPGG